MTARMAGATGSTELLCAFANTLQFNEPEPGAVDVYDTLSGAAEVTAWLREHGLVPEDAAARSGDFTRALAIRNGLREAFALHHDRVLAPVPALDEVARALPLRVAFDESLPRLTSAGSGVAGGLGLLLVAVAECRSNDTWRRLKLCRSEVCQWAYFDVSKNRSRAWCSMEICGNRQKTRSYRARHRSPEDP
ncbi:CGNR zinc finger domain-containing protein [Tenggerimyces flavus]|uniref:CGNR zinc finger domain-containing protein n=1 Tax=Tenggerimyces flavus TaxID=1708749 RepID=A0ABV7YC80_9ACTN|nr:CGNR zinc finger domain-containing protein [Tenggerimyces flavus]MBM7786906.1 putative RNA-binding Zn ribbon-like protein [Tenggerimyces flavus]